VRRLYDTVKMKLSPDDGDFGSKKCKRYCDGAFGGIWRSVLLWVELQQLFPLRIFPHFPK
jgi:hypothetical protein